MTKNKFERKRAAAYDSYLINRENALSEQIVNLKAEIDALNKKIAILTEEKTKLEKEIKKLSEEVKNGRI